MYFYSIFCTFWNYFSCFWLLSDKWWVLLSRNVAQDLFWIINVLKKGGRQEEREHWKGGNEEERGRWDVRYERWEEGNAEMRMTDRRVNWETTTKRRTEIKSRTNKNRRGVKVSRQVRRQETSVKLPLLLADLCHKSFRRKQNSFLGPRRGRGGAENSSAWHIAGISCFTWPTAPGLRIERI